MLKTRKARMWGCCLIIAWCATCAIGYAMADQVAPTVILSALMVCATVVWAAMYLKESR